ncbi:MAG: protein phosphatase 2C domain-containing protein [Pirellulaceae bacterium]
MTLGRMDCFAVTDLGRKRNNNEDQFLVADLVKSATVNACSIGHDECEPVNGLPQGKLILVADGMGGHAAGQRASRLAADQTLKYFLNELPWSGHQSKSIAELLSKSEQDQVACALKQAVKSCQKVILDEASWNPRYRGMGTTLTLALVQWPLVYVAHVGDSRCYALRGGNLVQLTCDHTYSQALIDAGEMTADEATRSPLAHTLWNVIGGNGPSLEPAVDVHQLEIGDSLLLCTDGLTNHVCDDQLGDVLASGASAREACQTLVQLANEGGGRDNITAVVARFVDANSQREGFQIEAENNPLELDFTLSDSTLQHIDDETK